jgi:hypothetical protein
MVFDIRKAARPGLNRLAAHVTLIGRHNTGRPIHTGLLRPPVYYTQRETETLTGWETAEAQGGFLEEALNVSGPALAQLTAPLAWRALPPEAFAENDRKALDWGKTWRSLRWYRACARHKGGPVFLELPPCDQVWVYANHQLAGMRFLHESKLIPLGAPAPGDIPLLVACLSDNWQMPGELRALPKLFYPAGQLEGPWFRRLAARAAAPPALAGMAPYQPGARLVTARYTVQMTRPPGPAAPVFVALTGDWHGHGILYWNGKPLGRYAHIGPDRKFYLEPDRLAPENQLTVCLNGYDAPARLGSVEMGCYGEAAVFEMEWIKAPRP